MDQRFDACRFHVRIRRQVKGRIELRAGGSALGRAKDDVMNERVDAVGGHVGVFMEIPVRVEESVRVFSCLCSDRDEMSNWVSCGIGIVGVTTIGPWLLVFIAVGPLLVLGYNLELFGGRLHTDLAFAAAWGAFPVLVGYFAQAERLDLTAVLGAAAALGLSFAQRALSTPARALRRRVTSVDGSVALRDGTTVDLDARALLRPLERALRAMSWAVVALALALVFARVL